MPEELPKSPTPARSGGVIESFFGVPVEDPDRWLEDASDPEVQRWVEQHDAAARQHLEALPLRAELAARLGDLLYVDQRSVPIKRGSRYFFSEKPRDKEKAIHYFREGKGGPAVALIDANALSRDGSVSVGTVIPSYDGKWVLYLEHPDNADEGTLRLLSVDTRSLSAIDTISGLRYTSPSWARDGSGFYYLWLPNDPSIPSSELVGHGEIRFHRLGTDPASDARVFPATNNPSQFLHADVSHDGSQLFVYRSEGWTKNDVFVKDLRKDGPFERLTPEGDALYSVATFREHLFIKTNEGAPRFRVFAAHRDHPSREHWREIVPEHESAVLEDAHVVGGRLVTRYLVNAYSQLHLRDLDGTPLHQVELPTIGTSTSLFGSEDEDEAYFEFSSFTHPREIWEFDVKTQARALHYRAQVPVDQGRFVTKQEWFTSKDGTRVPMFLVFEERGERSPRPTLLSGYGGFNVPMLPHFNATLFPWLERGGIFAMPNLRGGGEFGRDWHQAGRGPNKQRVFDDFIAAAEHLIEQGYTTPERLAISGRSNGGLLVGAAMTQRPELFGAVLCGVPVLDMLRFHRVGIGSAWVPEYGDVSTEAGFRTLFAYSPYHRIEEEVRYPPLLMLSADADDRVDPMHARKFVARLSRTKDAKVWLRVERNAGHGGADLRRRLVERTADEYAFLFDEIGR